MNKVTKQVMALILVITNTLALAAESGSQANGAGVLIEAAKYLEQSLEEMDCSTSSAIQWSKKAQSTLDNFRGRSAGEEATAAVLRARISVSRARIKERDEALKTAAKQIPKFMDSHLIGSALRSLDRVEKDAPTCDPRFKGWRREASDQYAAAAQLVREGDRMLSEQPRHAKKLYEAARKINREQPGVDGKIRRASEAARALGHGANPVVQAVAWTLVIGALVAGAAYADKYQKQQQAKANAQRR